MSGPFTGCARLSFRSTWAPIQLTHPPPKPPPPQPPDGYGEAGTASVPPNSDLEVDLKLAAVREVTLVAPGVVKKTLEDSTEWKMANEGAKVTLRWV